MKYLLKYKQFESKINEGGGAGISIDNCDISINVSFDVTLNKIDNFKSSYNLGETIDVKGYDDGMLGIKTEGLFNITMPETISYETIANITFENLKKNFYENVFIEDIFDNYNGEETIGDYLKNNEHEIIKIESDKSYAINDMIFGGWVRGKVETGMLLTIKEDDLTGEYSYDYINDVKVDLSINLIPKIEFAEGFVHFYDSVFANVHENYEAYLKSTLKENDSLDNDIEEYIENNNLTISVEEFKADDKLVSDLAEDLASEAKDWDDYYSMLEDEFKN